MCFAPVLLGFGGGWEGPVNLFNSRAQNQEAHLIPNIGHVTELLSVVKIIFWCSTCLLSILSNWIRTWARKNICTVSGLRRGAKGKGK